ncbi:hypothetical protein TIFTF001_032969 [Ficus carica]|uniref:High mobility group B protein 15 n=1 Tax=Ficus carica TaxID=3494 RepID=A0AA88E4G2_FICCA|nr:hypothetical protein TIFTF001_032969 [Ficus carica]
MASTSSSGGGDGKTPLLERETPSIFHPYPQLDGKYEDIAADPKLFMDNLEKLHASMGTKFMIPIIGGKELDLHRLFLEVTSRGGIEKILSDKKWKQVTAVFNFPSTATNASFVLRKYYNSLLHHYEQIYYFKARGWISVSGGPLLRTPVSAKRTESLQSSPPEIQAATPQQAQKSDAEMSGARTPASSAGTSVIGVIDGKFESGYLVTVTIGSEKLKGVLYQSTQDPLRQIPQGAPQQTPFSNRNDNVGASSVVPGVHRRRRRKKCEIKRRDPAHPKPNRSGYNFFFAEQHARLKPLHPGKDRDISRMIGELWNKITESERAVYQDKAVQDKERYRVEMEGYRKRLRTGEVISDAVPLQQRFPEPDIGMTEAEDSKTEEAEGGDSATLDNETSSSKSDSEDVEIAEKNSSDAEESHEAAVGADSGIVVTEPEEGSERTKHDENAGDSGMEKTTEEREENFGSEETKEEESKDLI